MDGWLEKLILKFTLYIVGIVQPNTSVVTKGMPDDDSTPSYIAWLESKIGIVQTYSIWPDCSLFAMLSLHIVQQQGSLSHLLMQTVHSSDQTQAFI